MTTRETDQPTPWARLMAHMVKAATQAPSPEVLELQKEWMAAQLALMQSFSGAPAEGEAAAAASPRRPPVKDRRFSSEHWSASPFYDYLRRSYLLNSHYLAELAERVDVAEETDRQRLRFCVRQFVDAMAPSNFAATNPDVIQAALDTKGESLRRGLTQLLQDLQQGRITSTDLSAFEVGRNLATTPGAVIFENEVFQLIQYAPLTPTVGQRPLLIVPPCINKFYILDLQEQNSFVRHAVEQGVSVFLVSWRNVSAAQGTLTWDDYLDQGVLRAIDVVRDISGMRQINALGFCVGGTMLTSALAVAKARGQSPVKSLTLLTTLLDFSEPGELGVFIDDTLINAHEARIGSGGILTGRELAAVFSSLRSNDLIWHYVVGNYLKGEAPPPFDLLFWNADSTNLSGPFLVWYLRHMYRENRLRQPGALAMCGVPVDVSALDMPVFAVAAVEDHIVPWKSAYASQHLLAGERTFVLGASGHIAGVVNPPASNRRGFHIGPARSADADAWLASAEEQRGSWWPAWIEWLQRSSGRRIRPRDMGQEAYPLIEPAPGRYVLEKA